MKTFHPLFGACAKNKQKRANRGHTHACVILMIFKLDFSGSIPEANFKDTIERKSYDAVDVSNDNGSMEAKNHNDAIQTDGDCGTELKQKKVPISKLTNYIV